MDPYQILSKYYKTGSPAHAIMLRHARQVASKALFLARRRPDLQVDLEFVEQAALLHDIAAFMTHAPEIGCFGTHPYIGHGVLGREILEAEGYPRHALVCERHVGVGISADEVRRLGLGLPIRDMVPLSLEEKLICYADKFFSKSSTPEAPARSPEEICRKLESYGSGKSARFLTWHKCFEPEG